MIAICNRWLRSLEEVTISVHAAPLGAFESALPSCLQICSNPVHVGCHGLRNKDPFDQTCTLK